MVDSDLLLPESSKALSVPKSRVTKMDQIVLRHLFPVQLPTAKQFLLLAFRPLSTR